MQRRLVIAGTGSGVGKTTLTIGLMAALKRKGFCVQGFKCGPDYIDPTYHTAVTGRVSRSLDSWMLPREMVSDIVSKNSEGADISIIEGVMGLFDGKDPATNEGTTAEISVLTKSPVVLVVDCSSMARSSAAIVKGFQTFWKETNIVGVIANQVGSEGHFTLIKTAVEQECGIPVVGYLSRNDNISIPERHLGLIPSVERGELDSFFDQLGKMVIKTIDVDRLYQLAEAPDLDASLESPLLPVPEESNVCIAVARDAAFNFYYEENLEMLKEYGAEIVEFSPLKGEVLPDYADGLYIGGGFPEEFAKELSVQEGVKISIRTGINRGLPTLAECGGFMFLTDAIETTSKENFSMVGIIPGVVKMQTKLAALGYREVTGESGNFLFAGNLKARGHEFHYSTFHPNGSFPPAYESKGMRGSQKEGYLKGNLVAGYTHFHFGSCPGLLKNWIKECRTYKKSLNESLQNKISKK
ncbi:cobyrinate a,c-diamide synthase [Mesobacillus foraminis]|uniref:cobyrinate a,c-diamide synthase n=1 Tax=Mesobacillus foraminis TaxID=279826 RepID=UPI0039A349BD